MNEAIEVSLDGEGGIVIPASVRRRLGLSPGMMLIVEQADDGSVRLRSSPGPVLVDEGGVLVLHSEVEDDLTDVVRRERDSRVEDLVRRVGP